MMKSLLVGCFLFFSLQATENFLDLFYMLTRLDSTQKYCVKGTSAVIAHGANRNLYTVRFKADTEFQERKGLKGNVLQCRGVSHGMGQHGEFLAALTAAFFQKRLSEYMTLKLSSTKKDGSFSEDVKSIEAIFQEAHTHLLENYSDKVEDSYCGVALLYNDFARNRLGCFQIGTHNMFGFEGIQDPFVMTLHDGGLEKYGVPSYVRMKPTIPSAILIGAPQVVSYLLPFMKRYLDSAGWKANEEKISAGGLWFFCRKWGVDKRYDFTETDSGSYNLVVYAPVQD